MHNTGPSATPSPFRSLEFPERRKGHPVRRARKALLGRRTRENSSGKDTPTSAAFVKLNSCVVFTIVSTTCVSIIRTNRCFFSFMVCISLKVCNYYESMCLCIHIYIYIYTCIEREMYMCMYIHVYIYIYIYIHT